MIYAIGDIHGQMAQLTRALDLIKADGGPDARIIFVGDYTDRGPESSAVLETLITGLAEGRNWTCLKGNHDRFFSHWVQFGREHDPRVASGISWINKRLGGVTTLASYGITSEAEPVFARSDDDKEHLVHYTQNGRPVAPDALQAQARAAVPQAHLDFLDNRPLTHETEDLLFVHAGLRPGIPLADQDPEDLLWIRDDWLNDPRDHGKLVVHGHTALERPQHYGNRVNIDGGAGYGRPLFPVAFEGRNCWTLTDTGRQPLRPDRT